jgi:hypothetical protein
MSENTVQTIKTSTADDYSERYSNHVTIRAGFLDFLLRFAVSKRPVVGEAVEVEFFTGVYLSPMEAKILAGQLAEQLRNYEAQWGKIQTLGDTPAPKADEPQESAAAVAASANGEVIQ